MEAANALSRKYQNARAIIKQLTALVTDPRYSTSYFPHEDHKSRWQIFRENVLWWLKYKEVNNFYYVYGLDRKNKEQANEVLPYREFRAIRDRRNLKGGAGFNYVCLLRDKFVFGQFLKSLGVATPQNFALIQNDRVTWLDTNRDAPLADIVATGGRDIDGFCKQLSGLCGEGAFPLRIAGGKLFSAEKEISIADLSSRVKGQYMLQQRIRQHDAMSTLHPQSVNTLRIITFNNNGNVEVFSATLRIGSGDKPVDNWASGGIIVGVDADTGTLRKHGLFKPGYGGKVEAHPDSHISFEGYQVPFFHDAIAQAKRLHGFMYGLHSIGWDVAITESGPVFIEGNDDWDGSIPMSVEKNFKTRFLNMFSRQQ